MRCASNVRDLRVVPVMLAVAVLAACGHPRTPPTQATPWNVRGPAPQIGDVAPKPLRLEADGLPEQAPPDKRIRKIASDPAEPFSRNYGPPPHVDAAKPPAGRTQGGEEEVAVAEMTTSIY